jgi:hypothetical protein
MFPPLLESVLLESDQNLVLYTFQLSDSDLNFSGTRLWHKWPCCVNFSLPHTPWPLYIQ